MKMNQLVEKGYQIKDAEIIKVDLIMGDQGCFTFDMLLQGVGWGCWYGGGRVLGSVDLATKELNGSPKGMEYIMRIMDVVGVTKFSDLQGKCVRAACRGFGSPVWAIGNIVEDRWFDAEEFFLDEAVD